MAQPPSAVTPGITAGAAVPHQITLIPTRITGRGGRCAATVVQPPFRPNTLPLSSAPKAAHMTTIGMHYDVIAGKEEEFEKGFLGVLDYLKNIDGHVESHLYEDVASVGSYVILSQWTTKQSFEAFIHSPTFKESSPGERQRFSAAGRGTRCTPTTEVVEIRISKIRRGGTRPETRIRHCSADLLG